MSMLVDAYRYAVAGGAPHRYWRVLITANDGSPSYCGASEIELRGAAGGPDLTTSVNANIHTSASSSVNSDNQPANAFNNLLDSGWLSAVPSTSWVRWDFTSQGIGPQSIAEVTITGSWNVPSASPRDFQLQWSDNGTAWTTVKTVTGQTGWTGSSDTRVFTI